MLLGGRILGQIHRIDGANVVSALPTLTGHQVLNEGRGFKEVEEMLKERRALRADLKAIQRSRPWQRAKEIRARLKFLQHKILEVVNEKVQARLL